ncbi:NAD(P)H-binding protein [Kribbella sp. NPDC051952]|uniref:SDR family oxidoreductase n=1 Tax=Kribbella sp. NPDC051952 TaxID=3154851 RepID=UPI00343E9C9D
MTSILVTGGTGTLGRPTVTHLVATGHQVRVLSRNPAEARASGQLTGPVRVIGDLTSGAGLAAAVDGVDTVVHLATSLGRRDIQQAQNLLAVLPQTTHLVLMSIVGIDRIPMGYYRHKLAVERLVVDSGRPHTILRATQFHNLLDRIFRTERFLPALLAPDITLQPIAVEDVAVRLTELVDQPPVNGRVPDIGGPERRPVPELARVWSRRWVIPLRVPGKAFRAFADGGALVDGPAYGTITFEEYLAA